MKEKKERTPREIAKYAFDLALKQSLGGDRSDGYRTRDGEKKYAYFTNAQWEEFLGSMKREHPVAFRQFTKGDGGELDEWRNETNGKWMPPKMASYASSSRFIFEASKSLGEAFTFECKLPIAFDGYKEEAKASLDGYIPSGRIFVEAKCHEFYPEADTEYKRAYREFYDYLVGKTGGLFGYRLVLGTVRGRETDCVRFNWNGEELDSLDLKQLLCHMLGIAKKALLEDCGRKSTLIYLVYRPGKDVLDLVPDEGTRSTILRCWEREKAEFGMVDFSLLYRLIVRYIAEYRQQYQGDGRYSDRMDLIGDAFEARFLDQEEYRGLVDRLRKDL